MMIGQVFLASIHVILLTVFGRMTFEKRLYVFEYCSLLVHFLIFCLSRWEVCT